MDCTHSSTEGYALDRPQRIQFVDGVFGGTVRWRMQVQITCKTCGHSFMGYADCVEFDERGFEVEPITKG